MKHVLIITEDIVKIQTLSGFLGGWFSFSYLAWLKLRLRLAIFFLKPFGKVFVVTSDAFELCHGHTYYYGDQLARLDYAAGRRRYLKLTDRLLKDIRSNLFHTRLAIYLTYHYFVYGQIYEDLIGQLKPELVITLSSSYHEQIARFVAKELKIKTIKWHWLTFVWLNQWLSRFFLKREYKKKIKRFLVQAKIAPPALNQLRNATLLSLDFFRHLKTLAPVYQVLLSHKRNPWLVTDITNLKSSLNNFKLGSVNRVFLASFLPAEFKFRRSVLPKKLTQIKTLDDYLHNLSLTALAPMIELGQILSQLYLAAAENLFKLVRPQAVIVVSDLRFGELALSVTARQTKTRSLLVSPNTIFALDKINAYNTTDTVAVVGEFIKCQLIDQGMNADKIHVIGDPQTENYRRLKLDKTKVYRILCLNPDKKIVLLISFGATWMIPKPEKKAFFGMALQAVAANPGSILVIKPHPTEKRYRLLEELKQWGINRAVVSDNNQLELVDLLHACSVVVQTWSMTIFEAIMMDRPVISISPFKKDYGFFLPILNSGGAVEVNDQLRLNRRLKTLLDPQQSFTRKQLIKAKRACVDFIKPVSYEDVTGQILNLLVRKQ